MGGILSSSLQMNDSQEVPLNPGLGVLILGKAGDSMSHGGKMGLSS